MIRNLFVIILLLPFFLSSEEPKISEEKKKEWKQLSFYRGYFLAKSLDREDTPYDFEQLIQGMRSFKQGEPLNPIKEEEFRSHWFELQNYLAEEKKKENLLLATTFLEEIAKKENMVCLVPEKLYYEVTRKSSGTQLTNNEHSPRFSYTIQIKHKKQWETIVEEKEPIEVFLKGTISGFAKGVTGMREGETRTLYIHPDLAYGEITCYFPPNSLVRCDVELISTNGVDK